MHMMPVQAWAVGSCAATANTSCTVVHGGYALATQRTVQRNPTESVQRVQHGVLRMGDGGMCTVLQGDGARSSIKEVIRTLVGLVE